MRCIVESADWTPELAAAALRYAQAYRELIDDLCLVRGRGIGDTRGALD